MAERKRNKEIHFYVTEEERKLIRRKMIESKTKNMGAYLRKMAIDGYIVNTDTTPLKKQYEEMHKIVINAFIIIIFFNIMILFIRNFCSTLIHYFAKISNTSIKQFKQ